MQTQAFPRSRQQDIVMQDLGKEMDLTKKRNLLQTRSDAISKISGELAGVLNDVVKSDESLIDLAFLWTLSRFPMPAESNAAVAHLKQQPQRAKAATDLFWAMMNSKEFLLAP